MHLSQGEASPEEAADNFQSQKTTHLAAWHSYGLGAPGCSAQSETGTRSGCVRSAQSGHWEEWWHRQPLTKAPGTSAD